MQQVGRPGGLFAIFRIIQYLSYIAIGLLVAAIAIWVVFGIKKLRWVKILAIVLTVLVLFTGLCSMAPYILRGLGGGQFPEGQLPQDRQQLRDRQDSESSSMDIDIDSSIIFYRQEMAAL